MKVVCMIPARIGSERVPRKNLRELAPGLTLLGCAVARCLAADCFDEVWVNTYDRELRDEARRYGAKVHVRPKRMAGERMDAAFKVEFLEKHPCDWCVIVNPTEPMVTPATLALFVDSLNDVSAEVVHSAERLTGSMVFHGQPVNFRHETHPETKSNKPIWHLLWAVTGIQPGPWIRRGGEEVYPEGKTVLYELKPPETVSIDTEADLEYARYLYRQHPVLG